MGIRSKTFDAFCEEAVYVLSTKQVGIREAVCVSIFPKIPLEEIREGFIRKLKKKKGTEAGFKKYFRIEFLGSHSLDRSADDLEKAFFDDLTWNILLEIPDSLARPNERNVIVDLFAEDKKHDAAVHIRDNLFVFLNNPDTNMFEFYDLFGTEGLSDIFDRIVSETQKIYRGAGK